MGYYGPLAMGEFPSYNPREDCAAPNTQMVVTNSHGSEECDKRKTPKQEQIYGEHKSPEVYETWANVLQMVNQEEYQNIMKQVIMGNDKQAKKVEQEDCDEATSPRLRGPEDESRREHDQGDRKAKT